MLIVLDIDDTLYLERDYVLSGFQAVEVWLHSNGYKFDFAHHAWQLFEQGHRGTIFNQVMDDFGHQDVGLIAQMVEAYRAHVPCIQLLPDAEAFLTSCSHHALAIISDGPLVAQENKVMALGLLRHVPTIILTDRWGRDYWKPHPRAFFEVMGQRAPGECVYIADNPDKDFAAPLALGWQPSIRIRRAHALHASKATPRECREAGSFDQLAFHNGSIHTIGERYTSVE